MSISLAKGQTLSLEKSGGRGLTKVFMGLGWDPAGSNEKKGFFGKLLGAASGGDGDPLAGVSRRLPLYG